MAESGPGLQEPLDKGDAALARRVWGAEGSRPRRTLIDRIVRVAGLGVLLFSAVAWGRLGVLAVMGADAPGTVSSVEIARSGHAKSLSYQFTPQGPAGERTYAALQQVSVFSAPLSDQVTIRYWPAYPEVCAVAGDTLPFWRAVVLTMLGGVLLASGWRAPAPGGAAVPVRALSRRLAPLFLGGGATLFLLGDLGPSLGATAIALLLAILGSRLGAKAPRVRGWTKPGA